MKQLVGEHLEKTRNTCGVAKSFNWNVCLVEVLSDLQTSEDTEQKLQSVFGNVVVA